MGAVCSAGTVEKNAEHGRNILGFSGQLKKSKSVINRKGDWSSGSSKKDRGKKQKKKDSDELQSSFSSELKLLTPTRTGAGKVCFT